MAAGLLVIVPIAVVFVVIQRTMIAGLGAAGIKG
jgi:ABC-type maltose transport system permease subunit